MSYFLTSVEWISLGACVVLASNPSWEHILRPLVGWSTHKVQCYLHIHSLPAGTNTPVHAEIRSLSLRPIRSGGGDFVSRMLHTRPPLLSANRLLPRRELQTKPHFIFLTYSLLIHHPARCFDWIRSNCAAIVRQLIRIRRPQCSRDLFARRIEAGATPHGDASLPHGYRTRYPGA